MSTAMMNEARGTGSEKRAADPRAVAFCAPELPDPFHAVAYASEVWRADPFDVDAIHRDVRDALRGAVDRVIRPSGVGVGRILLILGESGVGKTHLMRAFRNEMHAKGRGYVGYLPMTAYNDDYSRYVLAHLIESLDKPYDEPRSAVSGLMRLSNAMAEAGRGDDGAGAEVLERLRESAPGGPGLDDRVRPLVDRIALDPRFGSIDYDLLQALLYLQAPDPRLKASVLKYLRCEDLGARDCEELCGLAPRIYGSASQWMIQRLGELMWAVERVPLVLCVDQLEDMLDVGDAPSRFRRVLATLCDVTSRLPAAIVIVSCLENFYDEIRQHLTQPIRRRVSGGLGPLSLPSACDRDQVIALVSRRLESLYCAANVPFDASDPTYPLPDAMIRQLVGLGARDVLEEVGRYHAACVSRGKMVAYPPDKAAGEGSRELDRKIAAIEQEWSDRRSRPLVVPSDETDLAAILAEAIAECSVELDAGGASHYEATADGRFVEVERHGFDDTVDRLLVGLCNKAAQGGGLGNQVDEVIRRAGGITPVIVRSTAFPATAKSQVMQQLDKLVDDGGRRVVVEDSEWRTLMALSAFRSGREADPTFAAWLVRTRPLTRLAAIRGILGLDRAGEPGSIGSTA